MNSAVRIAGLEAELKKEEAVLKEFNKLPEDQRLATLLHDTQCHAAHEDQCGWYYERFDDNPSRTYSTKQEYLKKARKLLTVASYSDIEKIVVIMNESFF